MSYMESLPLHFWSDFQNEKNNSLVFNVTLFKTWPPGISILFEFYCIHLNHTPGVWTHDHAFFEVVLTSNDHLRKNHTWPDINTCTWLWTFFMSISSDIRAKAIFSIIFKRTTHCMGLFLFRGPNSLTRLVWLCECDCGNMIIKVHCNYHLLHVSCDGFGQKLCNFDWSWFSRNICLILLTFSLMNHPMIITAKWSQVSRCLSSQVWCLIFSSSLNPI